MSEFTLADEVHSTSSLTILARSGLLANDDVDSLIDKRSKDFELANGPLPTAFNNAIRFFDVIAVSGIHKIEFELNGEDLAMLKKKVNQVYQSVEFAITDEPTAWNNPFC